MQIAFIDVPSTWTALTDLISEKLETTFTFDVNKRYLLEGRGQGDYNGGALLLLSDTLPADTSAGNLIDNNGRKIGVFGQGTQTLYVKLFRNVLPSGINISTLGE